MCRVYYGTGYMNTNDDTLSAICLTDSSCVGFMSTADYSGYLCSEVNPTSIGYTSWKACQLTGSTIIYINMNKNIPCNTDALAMFIDLRFSLRHGVSWR